MSLIEQFKLDGHEKSESESATDEGIIYQFKYRPEQARLEQTARLSEMESRLHQLEIILGSSDDKLARLASGNKKGK